MWQRFRDRGVVVVGVDPGGLMGGDNSDILQQFADQTGVTFPIGIDLTRTYNNYAGPPGISPFPLDIIVDKQGKIAYLNRQFDAESMVNAIEILLAE